MAPIEIETTGTVEQELDALMQALLAETDNQSDATPEELEKLTEQLAEELAGLT